MSSHGARVAIQSPLENKRLNLIPVGRQLQRTPPNKTSKSQTSHLAEGPAIKDEEDSQVGFLSGISPNLDTLIKNCDRNYTKPVHQVRDEEKVPGCYTTQLQAGE